MRGYSIRDEEITAEASQSRLTQQADGASRQREPTERAHGARAPPTERAHGARPQSELTEQADWTQGEAVGNGQFGEG